MYHESLNILMFTKDPAIEAALRQVAPLEHFDHVFMPAMETFSVAECSDASILILDVPLADIPANIRMCCATVDPRIVYCDRGGIEGEALDHSELLEQLDAIWPLPASEQRLQFYFRTLLRSIKERKEHWVYSNVLETAIDSVPDLIWVKDTKGAHLKVNEAFCRMVKKTKEQCQNRGHYYIWDMNPEEYAKGEYVCLESEETVMREKKTCVFDEKIKGLDGRMLQVQTYKSPIFDEDGAVMGTLGIARDVTNWKNQAAELSIILTSLPAPAMIVDKDGKVVTLNKALCDFFMVDKQSLVGNSYAEWKNRTLHFVRMLQPGEKLEMDYEHNGIVSNLEILEEPIFDIFQQSVGHFCMYADVTEHKKHITLLTNYKKQLESAVQLKTRTIQDIQKKILISFADLVTSRDTATGDHIKNTSMYVDILVEELKREGTKPELKDTEYCDDVCRAVPLHDIGKIAIPDAILNKAGRYLPDEYEVMKSHAKLGGKILSKTLAHVEEFKYFKIAWDMAVYHHERWDGAGYPRGLKGEEIPLPARIMSVADVFDALISKRPYRQTLTIDQAYVILKANAGTQFDPEIVAAFIMARPVVEKIVHEHIYRIR